MDLVGFPRVVAMALARILGGGYSWIHVGSWAAPGARTWWGSGWTWLGFCMDLVGTSMDSDHGSGHESGWYSAWIS